jgi:hypothetical protein
MRLKKDKKILKYHKSNLSKEGNEMKNAFYRAIEKYFVKAIFDEYNICIRVNPTSFYKSTTEPFIRFKFQKGNDTEHNSFLELCSALILISFFRY